MEKLDENVERMINEYFELEKKRNAGHLSEEEKDVLGELSVYFFRISEIYRILKDKSKTTELTEVEMEHLAKSETILIKRYQPVIGQMSIQELSKYIFRYKYNDGMTSFDEFHLQLIINTFVEKVNLFFKGNSINIINEYYELSNKKRSGITLTSDEEKRLLDLNTYLDTLEEIYNVYKSREDKNTLSEEERQNLALYEKILVDKYKVGAQQSTTFLLDICVTEILSSGLISPSQRLNLDIMQQIMKQRESEFDVELPIKRGGK